MASGLRDSIRTVTACVPISAQFHSPADRRECGGCDFDGFEAERPEWPCRTWTLLDEKVPECPDSPASPDA